MYLDRRQMFVAASAVALAPSVRADTPKSLGFDPAKLALLDAEMQGLVDSKKLAGVVTLVARRGKLVSLKAHGERDLASHSPLATDSIFRIASMTKPICGVAMMILFEQGQMGAG